jgi:hypothetical protein
MQPEKRPPAVVWEFVPEESTSELLAQVFDIILDDVPALSSFDEIPHQEQDDSEAGMQTSRSEKYSSPSH